MKINIFYFSIAQFNHPNLQPNCERHHNRNPLKGVGDETTSIRKAAKPMTPSLILFANKSIQNSSLRKLSIDTTYIEKYVMSIQQHQRLKDLLQR
jgi:hypothetical protein